MKIAEYLKTKCPECGSKDTAVKKVWRAGYIKSRRHLCNACQVLFISQERVFVKK